MPAAVSVCASARPESSSIAQSSAHAALRMSRHFQRVPERIAGNCSVPRDHDLRVWIALYQAAHCRRICGEISVTHETEVRRRRRFYKAPAEQHLVALNPYGDIVERVAFARIKDFEAV